MIIGLREPNTDFRFDIDGESTHVTAKKKTQWKKAKDTAKEAEVYKALKIELLRDKALKHKRIALNPITGDPVYNLVMHGMFAMKVWKIDKVTGKECGRV